MKRWMVVAVLAALLAVAVAGVAWAQGPANPPTPPADCACGMTPGSGMGGGMRGGMRGMPEWAGNDEAVEKLLGMTEEQLQAERLAGKSLVEIAKGKGVTEAQLTQAIMDDRKADLDKLVADGKLTQAQAETMLTRMAEMVKEMINRTTTGPAWNRGESQAPSVPGSGNRQPMMGRDGQDRGANMAPQGRGARGGTMGPRLGNSTPQTQ